MSKEYVVVIGGTGGIGRAITEILPRDQWTVISTTADTVSPSTSSGDSVLSLDLRSDESIHAAFEKIYLTTEVVNALVFAASAPLVPAPLLETPWSVVEAHLAIQLKGFVSVLQELKPQIAKQQRTKIVLLLSQVCIGNPPPRLAGYVSAKYALWGYAKAAALELAPLGCTINIVSPGMVDTPLISVFPSKMKELSAMQNPRRRIASPNDVAGVVSFLLSDAAEYLNGAHITVNGGEQMF